MARRRTEPKPDKMTAPGAASAGFGGPEPVREVVRAFSRCPAFRAVPRPGAGQVVPVGGLFGSAKSLFVAGLLASTRQPLVVCCLDDIEVQEWTEDLELFCPAGRADPIVLPELDLDENLAPVAASLRVRTNLIRSLQERSVLLCEMSALMAPVAPVPAKAAASSIDLRVGASRDPAALLAELRESGLRRVPQVLRAGEVSARGDVLDIFPEGAALPLRVEFFDEEIESIRHFDPADQTSTEHRASASITLSRGDDLLATETENLPFPLDLMGARTIVVVVEPVRFEEQLSRFTLKAGTLARPVAAFRDALRCFGAYSLSTLPAPGGHDLGIEALKIPPVESWDLQGRILAAGKLKERPLIVLRSEAEVQRLLRLARQAGGRAGELAATTGHLARGFRIPHLGRALLNHGEFFGSGVARRRSVGRRRRAPVQSRAIDSFFELESGDLVVHAVHGIARFLGMERAARGVTGGAEDHLRLLFQSDVEVLVPVSKIDLVQKYVGAGQAKPALDKVGGRSFAKRKAMVAQALQDMASELLEVQVKRQHSPGFACPRDDELYEAFVRGFPYEDTPDQAKSSGEIVADLCATRPMDRLLCGDVGFGKTELAMRAAFRVVSAGRQVAMLVPTTLLADQHGRTFRERFAPFPVRIEVLSRLQTAKEKREIVQATAAGRVDILIGTHRLLGKDVGFKSLGLLMIDEEQRFGVGHKEKIRQLRAHVDVLTLTATPIPRTLHMALLGIKDISSLATPPPGRLEIETHVLHRQTSVIRNAILREVARGGQVFFLHNRVFDIDRVRGELEALVPEARVVVGHGQMSERELLRSMQTFLRGEADVLLSTTIVESGIDIPRANTILIDSAANFGLADLHQLRGRVGRDVHKAHCLLLVDPLQPMTPEAKGRLQAMERFCELGAGFQIAMRDLEIRGAGNLLGAEQSGHIAAIGYDMYCKLLQAAVERTHAPGRPEPAPELVLSEQVDVDLGVEAFLPESLAGDQRLRLALLREMDTALDEETFETTHKSLRDRFGRLPAPAENLLSLFVVKHQLSAHGVRGARFEPPNQIVLQHAAGRGPQGRWLKDFVDVRPISPGRTCLVLGDRAAWHPEQVLAALRDALLGRPATRRLRREERTLR